MKTTIIVILSLVIVYLLIKDQRKESILTSIDNFMVKFHNYLQRKIQECKK